MDFDRFPCRPQSPRIANLSPSPGAIADRIELGNNPGRPAAFVRRVVALYARLGSASGPPSPRCSRQLLQDLAPSSCTAARASWRAIIAVCIIAPGRRLSSD